MKFPIPTNILLAGIGALVVVGGVGIGIRYSREAQQLRKQLQELTTNPQKASEEEVKKLVDYVGKLIALPEGEQPTVATVSDKEKLKELPFFSRAENGDKVLIYVNARKAFLYRPSSQKLIEVASINLNTGATAEEEKAFAPKVAMRNGTPVVGLTTQAENQLTQAYPQATVVVKDNAKRTDIEHTVVVDISGKRAADAQRIAAVFHASVGPLPDGEKPPTDVEFLVLLGKDATTASPVPSATPSPSAPSPSPAASP